ncbi:hypothetical protein D7I39_10075 [Allopusillimonas ginsengisoli]|nr:hypothetical protein D7I39_10075 [Allopusillimonas ginsengisoli]
MAARRWTLEQRLEQAEKIRSWKPWVRSTGAKTAQGKAMSSRNAYKGGVRRKGQELRKALRTVLREQAQALDSLKS